MNKSEKQKPSGNTSRKIVLISYHSWFSNRKAGFHWLANSYASKGFNVLFVTAPISLFSIMYWDHRLFTKLSINRTTKISDNITIYTYFTLIHPENYKKIKILTNKIFLNDLFYIFDKFFSRFFKNYGTSLPKSLEIEMKDANYIIFESTPGIMLLEAIKQINPESKKIYRMSDDMELIGHHQIVKSYEKNNLQSFDLVSIPSPYLLGKVSGGENVKISFHGIDTKLFNTETLKPNIYNNYKKNLVFVGCSFFDNYFLEIASNIFPEYGFHIIGPINKSIFSKNVHYYGEMAFIDTIPYLKHADCGLQTLYSTQPVSVFCISLKVLQYTWCKLPIIIPTEMDKKYTHFFQYSHNRESIMRAIRDALLFDRESIDTTWIKNWDEIADDIIKAVDNPDGISEDNNMNIDLTGIKTECS